MHFYLDNCTCGEFKKWGNSNPVGVKHWHGAAKDSWFSHLAVEVPGDNGSNEWLEAVDDGTYNSLK